MKLLDAINDSNCGTAECFSPLMKGIPVAMGWGPRDTQGRFRDARIVKGITDPTVVRKLRMHEIENEYWQPWNSKT